MIAWELKDKVATCKMLFLEENESDATTNALAAILVDVPNCHREIF